jgi:hypothetical protein
MTERTFVSGWGWFLLVVAMVCLAGYSALYGLIVSPAFCTYTRSFAEIAPCYKFDVQGKNVDVLLVGDSALLYGVRPSFVEKASHVSSYNYGMQGPAFSFDPQVVVDRYLAANEKPKAIVVYLSPWNRIVRHELNDPQWFPLAVLTLRHQLWANFFRLLLARPPAVVEIPQIILKSIGLSRVSARNWRLKMANDDGYFDYASTLSPEQTALGADCGAPNAYPSNPYAADNRKTLGDLRSHYATIGLPVYIYVAPTAQCDGKIEDVRKMYRGLADNDPVALANEYFANDNPLGRHSHQNKEGTDVASALLADFLSRQSFRLRN